ncbi:hypothetical protein B0T18DRAFT_395178 [Schizothecium vesticola]|uniref:Uncharacterized protein n=1 Tax=Schizothecium vesticola TaxID=314040 RepID=A0AA40BRE4_9PEZI|nr:hypothetical protein B0T18DRAFT_395178 [Schizothecium vesticola]
MENIEPFPVAIVGIVFSGVIYVAAIGWTASELLNERKPHVRRQAKKNPVLFLVYVIGYCLTAPFVALGIIIWKSGVISYFQKDGFTCCGIRCCCPSKEEEEETQASGYGGGLGDLEMGVVVQPPPQQHAWAVDIPPPPYVYLPPESQVKEI